MSDPAGWDHAKHEGAPVTPPKPTILVVDDDADARLIMGAALRKAGYAVRMATGGHDALAQFRANATDLVMLDVEMPDLGGYEVCRLLRAEAGPLLPVVMVTGMDDLESVESAYECGATDFIAKPVNWALVGHRVRYLLRAYQAMVDLRAAEARNAALLSAIPDLLFELDIDGLCIDYRAGHTNLLAAPADKLVGRTVRDLLPATAADICMASLRAALAQGSSTGLQFELALKTGNTWFEMSVSHKPGKSADTGSFIILSRNITERKESESRIERLAYFDNLTGLPNRHSFLERVDREVHRARRRKSMLAVLFMDLDGFKNVNDTMGHAAGDLILQCAAERLRIGLRPADYRRRSRTIALGDDLGADVELARLGGDEFTASGSGDRLPGGRAAGRAAHRSNHHATDRS